MDLVAFCCVGLARGSLHPKLQGERLFVVAKWEKVGCHVVSISIALGIC